MLLSAATRQQQAGRLDYNGVRAIVMVMGDADVQRIYTLSLRPKGKYYFGTDSPAFEDSFCVLRKGAKLAQGVWACFAYVFLSSPETHEIPPVISNRRFLALHAQLLAVFQWFVWHFFFALITHAQRNLQITRFIPCTRMSIFSPYSS